MMKQTLSITIAFLFGLQVSAEGTVASTGNTTYLNAPTVPVYEKCNYLSVSNNQGGTYQVLDSACVARNEQKSKEYQGQLTAYNYSSKMLNAQASTLTRPVEPTYEVCNFNEGGSIDNPVNNSAYYACMSSNQAKKAEFDRTMLGWNELQKQQATANANAYAEQLAAQQAMAGTTSATEALEKAQQQNQSAAKKSNNAATIAMGVSVAAGAAFAGSCAMMGGCVYPFLATSIAFGLISSMSSKQAGQNYASAYQACTTEAKLTASTKSCGNAPSTAAFTPTPNTSALTSNFDSNGNCTATDKTICDQIKAALPPGTNIKDAMNNISAFAGANAPYKFNADGSITTKDGKTVKPSDLNNRDALIAAGFTPSQADAMMNAAKQAANSGFAAPANTLDKATGDLKGSKGYSNLDFSGKLIGDGSESSGSTAARNAAASGALSSKVIGGSSGKDANGNRSPASAQGLTRDFNGETIGASGDDIFSMMNRRYKMKTSQDSFISN